MRRMRKVLTVSALVLVFSSVLLASALEFVPKDAGLVVYVRSGEELRGKVEQIPLGQFLIEDMGVEDMVSVNIGESMEGVDPDMVYEALEGEVAFWGDKGAGCLIVKAENIEDIRGFLEENAEETETVEGFDVFLIGEKAFSTAGGCFLFADSEDTLKKSLSARISGENILRDAGFREVYGKYKDKLGFLYAKAPENISEEILAKVGKGRVEGYLDAEGENLILTMKINYDASTKYGRMVDEVLRMLEPPFDVFEWCPPFAGIVIAQKTESPKEVREKVREVFGSTEAFKEAEDRMNDALSTCGLGAGDLVEGSVGEVVFAVDFARADEDGNPLSAIIVPVRRGILEKIEGSGKLRREGELLVGEKLVVWGDKLIFTNMVDGVREVLEAGGSIKDTEAYRYASSLMEGKPCLLGVANLGGWMYEAFSIDSYMDSAALLEVSKEGENVLKVKVVLH